MVTYAWIRLRWYQSLTSILAHILKEVPTQASDKWEVVRKQMVNTWNLLTVKSGLQYVIHNYFNVCNNSWLVWPPLWNDLFSRCIIFELPFKQFLKVNGGYVTHIFCSLSTCWKLTFYLQSVPFSFLHVQS